MTAIFKAKIHTNESGMFIKVPKITSSHISESGGYGQLAALKIERKLDLRGSRILFLPSDKVICINGGFISEFQISEPNG